MICIVVMCHAARPRLRSRVQVILPRWGKQHAIVIFRIKWAWIWLRLPDTRVSSGGAFFGRIEYPRFQKKKIHHRLWRTAQYQQSQCMTLRAHDVSKGTYIDIRYDSGKNLPYPGDNDDDTPLPITHFSPYHPPITCSSPSKPGSLLSSSSDESDAPHA